MLDHTFPKQTRMTISVRSGDRSIDYTVRQSKITKLHINSKFELKIMITVSNYLNA